MAWEVFTGLVQMQGQLAGRSPREAGFRLSVKHGLGPLELGESIAVNGVCLTVTACHPERFDADTSVETVSRTTLGELPIGRAVHLERALRLGDRLGGHIVAGHVDAVTKLLSLRKSGESNELTFELPGALRAYVAEKGSIAIDGVSLTSNRVTSESFSAMVVPYTLNSTHLGLLRRGDAVNLEIDVLARYVVHAARVGFASEQPQGTDAGRPDRETALQQTLLRAGIL
jgi:riboflavin synthase